MFSPNTVNAKTVNANAVYDLAVASTVKANAVNDFVANAAKAT